METSKAKLVDMVGIPSMRCSLHPLTPFKVKAAAPRSYLQYRVPEGELLAELRNVSKPNKCPACASDPFLQATAPPYTMKSIKPPGADSNRARRKTVSRKPTLIISDPPPAPAEKPAPAKRRQSLKAKPSVPPTPIACHACGQTDVPLMMGGSESTPATIRVQTLLRSFLQDSAGCA